MVRMRNRNFPVYVVILSLFAATGGLMFGYDVGISGGVTAMDGFLCQVFPKVLEEKKAKGYTDTIGSCSNPDFHDKQPNNTPHDMYCLYRNETIILFTSSMYVAAMVATCFAAIVCRNHGRKITMLVAGLFYDIGVALSAAAGSLPSTQGRLAMLICGRVLLGFGVGFGNQAVPLYISEIAPADRRGSLNNLFQFNVTLGILIAGIVNLLTEKNQLWGWRLSLGLAGVPAILLTIGSLIVEETPNSLVQRGKLEEAQEVLNKLRGNNIARDNSTYHNISRQNRNEITNTANVSPNPSRDNVNQSFTSANSPKNASLDSASPSLRTPSINAMLRAAQGPGLLGRENIPPLIITVMVQFFQQFTGINVVMFYFPVMLKSLGVETDTSLYSAVAIGAVNVVSMLVSMFLVDRVGRRFLLLEASVQMLVAQVLLGLLLRGTGNGTKLSKSTAIEVVVLVCVFVSAFSWSWGPLGWLISTETFPLSCRSAGQSVTVFTNMLFTFVIAQSTLFMLCTMKSSVFFFFAAWSVVMGALTYLFLPETMNMEIEVMDNIWSYHWFWKRFMTPSSHVGNDITTH